MDTKGVGNIGEAKVLCKFVELGIPVYLPFGDNERSDLIAEFNGKLNRIQVKTSVKAEDGKMIFDLTSYTFVWLRSTSTITFTRTSPWTSWKTFSSSAVSGCAKTLPPTTIFPLSNISTARA